MKFEYILYLLLIIIEGSITQRIVGQGIKKGRIAAAFKIIIESFKELNFK